MESTNSIILSGNVVADAQTNDAKSFARFSIAHNMGKTADGAKRTVFANFVMFAKNHKRSVNIPFDLLKKGTAVKVEAYFSPKEDNKGFEFFVKNVSALTKEEKAAEDAAETAPAEQVEA